MTIEPAALAAKIQTVLNRYPDGVTKILLHKDDLEVLRQYPGFDDVPVQHGVKGFLWGTAIAEVDYKRSGILGVELHPELLDNVPPTNVLPWQEIVYLGDSDRAVDAIMGRFDNLFKYGLLDKALQEYDSLDLSRVGGHCLYSLAATLSWGSSKLPWGRIIGEIEASFLTKPGYDQARVNKLLRNLREPKTSMSPSDFISAINR